MKNCRNKRNLSETSPEQSIYSKKQSLPKEETKMEVVSMNTLKDTLNNILVDKLKNLATRDDVTKLYSEITSLRAANNRLTQSLSSMTARCELLENQLEILSRKSNECSVVVHLPLNRGTDATQLAIQTCKGLLKLDEGDNLQLKRSREIRNTDTQRGTVIMELLSAEIVDKIIAAAHQLKNSGISIFREQSLLYRKNRQTLVEFRNKLLAIKPSAKILVKGNKLQIENHTFVYKFARGLICKTSSEMTFIQQMFGDRSSEFFDCSEGTSQLTQAPSGSQLFPAHRVETQ